MPTKTRSATRSPSPAVTSTNASPLKSALKNRNAPRYGATAVSQVRIATTTLPPPEVTLAEGLRRAVAEDDREERAILSTILEGGEGSEALRAANLDLLEDISYSTRHEAGVSSNGPVQKASAIRSRIGKLSNSDNGDAYSHNSTTVKPGASDPPRRMIPAALAPRPTASRSTYKLQLPSLERPSFLRIPNVLRQNTSNIWRWLRYMLYAAVLSAVIAATALKSGQGLKYTWDIVKDAYKSAPKTPESPYPTPPVVSVNTENCLEHYESLESWLNSSFAVFEGRQGTQQKEDQKAMHYAFDRYRSDLVTRFARASKDTQACLQAREYLGQDVNSLRTSLAGLESKVGKLQQLVDAVHNPSGPQHMKNWMAAHLGAIVIPDLTSPTASFGLGFWQRMKYKFAATKDSYPPFEALRPWVEAGQCWCGVGPFVQIGVRLPSMIRPTLFRIEHVPAAGSIDTTSQPQNLEAWGKLVGQYDRDELQQALIDQPGIHQCGEQSPGMSHEWVCLGVFNMDQGSSLASLPVFADLVISQAVVKVKGNWGNEGWTCIYRVTLTGEPATLTMK